MMIVTLKKWSKISPYWWEVILTMESSAEGEGRVRGRMVNVPRSSSRVMDRMRSMWPSVARCIISGIFLSHNSPSGTALAAVSALTNLLMQIMILDKRILFSSQLLSIYNWLGWHWRTVRSGGPPPYWASPCDVRTEDGCEVWGEDCGWLWGVRWGLRMVVRCEVRTEDSC